MKICPQCSATFDNVWSTCPYDSSSLTDQSKDPLIGTTFAEQYEIISVLGSGGMSVVYKARHKLMDRIVAIKLLHGQNDPLAVERFKQEAKAASSLSHPNIISVFDFGIAGNQAYLVMDCLEGDNLSDVLIRDRRIAVDRAIRIFRQACLGLEHAHKKGIVHRDLKPSNLCLVRGEDGGEVVKIVDFGIAKLLADTGKAKLTLTQTGEIFGSPMYMSPEQCMAQPLDFRSDIYSIGCVMYECLTGVVPIMGETAYETMNMHVNVAPHPFAKVAPDLKIDKNIEAIVFRCLEKKPEERYQNVSEIMADLPVIKPESGSLKVKVVQHPTKTRREIRFLRYGFYTLAIFVLALFTYMSMDHGPETDRGTVLEKTIWNAQTTIAQSLINCRYYQQARYVLNCTEDTARNKFNNPGRLMTALNLQKSLFRQARMFEELEGVNKKIAQLNAKILLDSYKNTLQEVNDLSGANSPISQSVNKIMAPITYQNVERVARSLGGAGMDKHEESLLTRTREVYIKLLGSKDSQIGDIDMLLADCYLRQQQSPKVRPLLKEAVDIYEAQHGINDKKTILAIMRLGQFDRDENRYEDAKNELAKALKQAEKTFADDPYLLSRCLSSYAMYLDQTGNHKEANDLYAKASGLSPLDSLQD
jgi:serine/threonine-protein kinase